MRVRCGIFIVSISIVSIVLLSCKRLCTVIFGICLDLKCEFCVIRCQFHVVVVVVVVVVVTVSHIENYCN